MRSNPIAIHDNLQAFLNLAKAGLPVFPVNQDKRPLVKWKTAATTDLGQIRRWIAKWPDAMPAIPTGESSGLAVLDLDRKDGKDGFATIAALGFDPDTLSPVFVATPTGGGHLIFRHAPGLRSSAGQIGPGVDVRAEGGFVVAAGAVNGKGAYHLLSGSLTDDLPLWPEALRAPSRQPREAGQSEPTGLPFQVVKAALFALPNGGDAFASRDEWLRIGMALHAESDGSEEGLAAYQEWSQQHATYDAGATEAAWESFHAGGGVTGWTIIQEAEGYGWSDPVVTHLLWLSDFDNLMTAEEEAAIDALVGGPNEDAPAASSRGLTFLTPAECALLPARPYVIKGLLAQGDVAAIVGAPGAGKSLLAPRLGYAVAQGGEVFGRRTRQGGVLYVAAEDGHGMRGRLSALHQDHGNAEGFQLVGGVSDLLSKGGQLKALRAEVKARRPALVIIDTLAVAFPGLEENSAEGMGMVVAAARSLTTWGAAVVLIHHDTKAGDGLPRGHSLLNGALDMSLALTKDEDGIVTGRMSKNRNGPSDLSLTFSIGTRRLGMDDDGDPITTAICEEVIGLAVKRQPKLSESVAAAFAVFTRLSNGGPVEEADWNEGCVSGRQVSASDDVKSRRKAFKRAVETLTRRGLVDFKDGTYVPKVTSRVNLADYADDFPEEGEGE
jgi:hypothetical protein